MAQHIENDHQLAVTYEQREVLSSALDTFLRSDNESALALHPVLRKAIFDGYMSMAGELADAIYEYRGHTQQ